MNDWREFEQRDDLDRALAQHLAERLRQAVAEHGAASLAVSGGSTPSGLFARLAETELDWERVTVTLVDERWVDPDSPDSNERLVRENLLRQHASAARWVSLKSEHASPEAGLASVTQRLAAIPSPFTAVVLGMGGDGHTASWFPEATNLEALLAPPDGARLGATDPITAPHPRITLTLPAVLDSREIIIHITGTEKRSILESAAEQAYPVAAVTRQDVTPATIWWAP